MLRCRYLSERGLAPVLSALAVLLLTTPALAGTQGNLEPVGKLLLELDATTSQFRLDDGDGTTADPVQQVFDQKIIKNKDACLVGLTPDGSDPSDPNALVSLAGSPTDWGIDVGKLALGGRSGKGAGCGQCEFGEILRIQTNYLLITDASIQVEAKQDVSAKVTLILDDGVTETVVGTRYLLTGRAVSNPPPEIVAAPPAHVTAILVNRPDGGADSRENDDGFWIFEATFHNIEVFEILTNSDGTQGKLSIKGGGEYLVPLMNRAEWTVFDADGLLFCEDDFSTGSGAATGSRTSGGACLSRIPFDFDFDGEEMTFNVLDLDSQEPTFAFRVTFNPESVEHPPRRTVLAYSDTGVNCTGVDLEDQSTFTDACIGMTLCVGTPVWLCADGSNCQEDADCADESACELSDLLPPAVGGFPDLVDASSTLEYGCICEEIILPIGPGACDDSSSCENDADCTSGGTCTLFSEDQMIVEQCIFAVGDLKGSRKR